VLLDREKAAIATQPDIRPEISSDHPERELCYIIYTLNFAHVGNRERF
jgi:hypothetical protein